MQRIPSLVLVIEDDADIRRTVADCLEFDGYSVAQASDGQAALDGLEAGQPPDVILLDLMMPRMDGRAFLERMRGDSRFADIPVIVMTAAPPAAAASLGADAFLRKPFDIERLCALVAESCEGRAPPLTAAGT